MARSVYCHCGTVALVVLIILSVLIRTARPLSGWRYAIGAHRSIYPRHNVNGCPRHTAPALPLATATASEALTTTDMETSSKTHSDAARAKISAANKGRVPWNVGKQHSEETKRRIAEKTREAMLRRKQQQSAALGFSSVEEFEAKKAEERATKKIEKDRTKVGRVLDIPPPRTTYLTLHCIY